MIRQLVGHSAAYSFANFASRGIILAWLILLPRFLSVADYGALGLVMTVAAMVNVLVPLEISQGLARHFPGAPEGERRDWARTAWTFTLLTTLAWAAAALLLSRQVSSLLLGDSRYVTAFRLAIGYFVLNVGFVFVQNQFRWAFRPRDYTLVTLICALATLILSVTLAEALPNALDGVMAGLIAGTALGGSLGAWKLRGILGFGIDKARLKRMLGFSLPLVPASVSLLLSTYASRFILDDRLTLADVGLFTWASQLATIPALLLVGVQAAVTPLVMKHHQEAGTPAFLARSFEAIFAAALWLCLALGLAIPEAISLFGYSSYAAAGALVIILAPAYLLLQLYVFFPGFAVAERTSLQLLVSGLAAAAAIGCNYWLIGTLGLTGAAVATFLSAALFIVSWALLSHPLYPVPVRPVRLLAFIAAAAVCALVAATLEPGHPPAVALKLLLLIVLAAVAAGLGFLQPRHVRSLLASRREPRD